LKSGKDIEGLNFLVMQQPFSKFLMFRNRLQKVYKHLSKQALRQGISCYRVYDHDLPEFPFIIEIYEDNLYVSEYKRRHSMEEEEYEAWWNESSQVMADVLGVAPQNIFLKLRQKKEGRLGQYQKLAEKRGEIIVMEGGLKFIVNLTDYLDTGLFLDHRLTRQMVREMAKGKKVLNLFCYTGSFSVYAASGNASEITSIDLSKTYLDWAARNMQLNFPEYDKHLLVHADVKKELQNLHSESYDLIIMDPPTFSNSKRMDDLLDIQRDHVKLINDCIRILKAGGVLFFSTNFSKFQLQREQIKAAVITDITKATTPFDFAGKLYRQCFKIEK
jgi:23S rRNA (cytosine1962-C5)-methyltransferase